MQLVLGYDDAAFSGGNAGNAVEKQEHEQGSAERDTLKFFKNYFVTGDYVVGGIGLRGSSNALGMFRICK